MDYFKIKLRKLLVSVGIIFMVFFIGTFGFMFFENWSFSDAVFFTLVTLSTVGYTIPEQISHHTQIFTTFLIISGITVVVYSFTTLTAFIVEGEIKNFLGVKKMEKKIKNMKKHNIVVGAGKTGSYVILNLIKEEKEFVVIDRDEKVIKKLLENIDFLYVVGDIKEENVFYSAGIHNTETVILTLPTDIDNIYAGLTAKSLNPKIKVIAKANEPESVKKLTYAGIDKIVLDSEIIGNRLSVLATRPNVVNFLETMTRTAERELQLEQIEVPESSWIVNKSLKEISLPNIVDLIVISIKKKNGEVLFNPGANTFIQANDHIIVLGEDEKIYKLIKIIEQKEYESI